ncbi:MAG: YybH family protein [Planctomycetota bacterium]
MIRPTSPLVLSAFILTLLGSCASPHGNRGLDQTQAIEAVVRTQEAAWNRGDLEGYMSAGYLKSPELTFFAGGGVQRGYDTVLEYYRQRYHEGGREMGRLSFSELESINFGDDTGLVRGRWRLQFLDQAESAGLFSLILRRTPEGWRVVHDHTSVDAKP